MDHIDVARRAILDLGSEDYYHLGDAETYLPSVPLAQRHAVAREALSQLIQEGLVQLFFGRMATNDVAPVARDRVAAILDDPNAWEPEADLDHQSFCFTNTPLGDSVYQRGRTSAH
jgi:hypothetical protein